MPKINSKQIKIAALILLPLLIVSTTVGVALAYIIERTPASENTFVPVIVDSKPVNTRSGEISVMNDGEIPAYIRAQVVVNWVYVNDEGEATDNYHVNTPQAGVDYNIVFDPTGAWNKGSDGFWYYKDIVDVGNVTSDFIVGFERITDPPKGYVLSLEVLTTGIQSAPTTVVEQEWNVTVTGQAIIPN